MHMHHQKLQKKFGKHQYEQICLLLEKVKYVMSHMRIQDGTQMSVKKIQVLHHVKYFNSIPRSNNTVLTY